MLHEGHLRCSASCAAFFRLSASIKQPSADGPLQGADLLECFPALLGLAFRLDHHITEFPSVCRC